MSTELLQLTPVYTEVADGWVQATFLELPSVITVAQSQEAAAEDLVDALREFLLSFADGDAIRRDSVQSAGAPLSLQLDQAPAA